MYNEQISLRDFLGAALEDVDERVENGHHLVGDTSVRVDLLGTALSSPLEMNNE